MITKPVNSLSGSTAPEGNYNYLILQIKTLLDTVNGFRNNFITENLTAHNADIDVLRVRSIKIDNLLSLISLNPRNQLKLGSDFKLYVPIAAGVDLENLATLISQNAYNQLRIGTDGKLFVEETEAPYTGGIGVSNIANESISGVAAYQSDVNRETKTALQNHDHLIASLANLGKHVGSFNTFSVLPYNVSAFAPRTPTTNDFANIRADENYGGATTRYIIDAIGLDGQISWDFDIIYSMDIAGILDSIGDTANLKTAANNLTDAVNEVVDALGDTGNLQTTANNLTDAVNEVFNSLDNISGGGSDGASSATPDIFFDNTDFNSFMQGFTRPLSGAVFNPSYADGPAHGRGNSNVFYGGVLLPNGNVVLVPRNSPNIGLYNPATNVYTDGPTHGRGEFAFDGGLLLPDGRVFLAPRISATIGLYNPATNTYTNGPAHGRGANAFAGSVLLPDGNVLLVPLVSPNIGLYNPTANTFTDGPAHGRGVGAFAGGVLLPDGNVLLVPHVSPNIGLYNSTANTFTDGPAHGRGNTAFNGGVLLPDGNVLLVPFASSAIGLYSPATDTFTSGPAHDIGGSAFVGGVLLPSGNVLLVPSNSPNIRIYNPTTGTLANGPVHGRGSGAFNGGVLLPDGNVLLVPQRSTDIGLVRLYGLDIGIGYCLHPYLNKL